MKRKKLLICCGLVLVSALVYGLAFAEGSDSEDGEARTAAEDPMSYVVGFDYGGEQVEVADKYSDPDEWEPGTRAKCIGIKIVNLERFAQLDIVPQERMERAIEEDMMLRARVWVVIPPDKTEEEVINPLLELWGAVLDE